jgi:anti-sigma factor ChrR (cupin superfamily)
MSLMPSCKHITEHSSDYVDRNLPWWTHINHRLHLMLCQHCRRYLAQMKLTVATLKHTQEATPPTVDEQHVKDIVAYLQKHATKPPKK